MIYQANIKYRHVPNAKQVYKNELKDLENQQHRPLLRNFVKVLASEVLDRMEAVIQRVSGQPDFSEYYAVFPDLYGIIQLVQTLDELLEDHDRERKYMAELVVRDALQGHIPDMRGGRVLEQIDDEIADLFRKFRRATNHSRSRQTYPKTAEAFKAIQKKVAYGWNL